ncbi:thioesterase II family protein [Rossellomorea aquimaris]|uniref:Surfactin synthase thioesterase subunit n=1 Tax=Rossellomorea aquimaris TaxID=189382 RepID=A0A366EI89_9BACI|nr:thioesterase domain-containing protein [Rossellomorea aquimaris]RBP02127.1 surfactin synthase thioesterase subunit [Rossellomorea aquimaris]
MKNIKLFCFPYAGGSSNSIFFKFRKEVNQNIDVIPIELKGRGSRFTEPFYESFEELIEDVYSIIDPETIESEYAFFGHSMGAKIAYYLCDRNEKLCSPQPVHLFLSGALPPTRRAFERKIYLYNNDDFFKEVIKLGGTPREVQENKELQKIYIPILKNDFKLLDTIDFIPDLKFPIDFSVLYGTNENINIPKLFEWSTHTEKSCEFYEFGGNHFFINSNVGKISRLISKELS